MDFYTLDTLLEIVLSRKVATHDHTYGIYALR